MQDLQEETVMTEKWGKCGTCGGSGERFKKVASVPIPESVRNMTPAEAAEHKVPEGGTIWNETVTHIAYPCAMCDSTGFSGDAFEQNERRLT